jgi:NADH-quinone oxidoreductase subunit A
MQPGPLWPLLVYFAAVLGLVAAMIAVSYVLGQRHSERATGEPFESGIVSVGYGRLRFPAHFYLVAVFFVIFDLEAVFIFAWAIVLHESGWAGYVEILVFIGILVAALIYLWRIGALDWGPEQHRRRSGLPPSLQHRSTTADGQQSHEAS